MGWFDLLAFVGRLRRAPRIRNPEKLFEDFVPKLVKSIPAYVAQISADAPLAIVRLRFYDTHAPYCYLAFSYFTVPDRLEVLRDPETVRFGPSVLWDSCEDRGPLARLEFPSKPPTDSAEQEVASLFQSVYALMCKDEEKYVSAFRAMLQKVCLQLNQIDWMQYCTVSNDFVIVPSDGSARYWDDNNDILASVPTQRLDLLRDRGFVDPTLALNKDKVEQS